MAAVAAEQAEQRVTAFQDQSLTCPNQATVTITTTRQAGAIPCAQLLSLTFMDPQMIAQTMQVPGTMMCQVASDGKTTTAVSVFTNSTGAIIVTANIQMYSLLTNLATRLGLQCAVGGFTDSLVAVSACPNRVFSRSQVTPSPSSCQILPRPVASPPPPAPPPPPPTASPGSGPCTACVTMYKQADVNLQRDCAMIANLVFDGPTSLPYVKNTGLIPQAGYSCTVKDPDTISVCATFIENTGTQLFIVQFDQTARQTNLANTLGLGCGPTGVLDSLLVTSPNCLTATSAILADKATCNLPRSSPPPPPLPQPRPNQATVEVFMLKEVGGLAAPDCEVLAKALILDPFTTYGANMPIGGTFKCDDSYSGKTLRLTAQFPTVSAADMYVQNLATYGRTIRLADVMGLRCWGFTTDYIQVKSMPNNLMGVVLPSACAVRNAQTVSSVRYNMQTLSTQLA